MNKLLIICGPTGTGKTSLGVSLAKHFRGEIISADSRQVYQGMDIVTGKDLPVNSKLEIPASPAGRRNSKLRIKNNKYQVGYRLKDKVPVWLVDIVRPDYYFNVADYKRLANKTIQYLSKKKKLPILVGGTGLYIKAITDTLSLVDIPVNSVLRKQIEKLNTAELISFLQNIDSPRLEKMNYSDRNNPRRLIRAIEIGLYLKTGKIKACLPGKKDILYIGLNCPMNILEKKIRERVDRRLKEGALDEIKLLLEKDFNWDLPSFSATGIRLWKPYILSGRGNINDYLSLWVREEINYAKRQWTWFKKIRNIKWFDISDDSCEEQIVTLVNRWYTSK